MVPKMSNGTQMVPKMVPKWYPNSLTHFIEWSIFIIFEVKKWPQGYFDHHFGYHTWFLGTIDYFFGTHTISATSEKKTGSLTRIIYLPNLKILIFGQIHDFHLWDTLHFLGTIEYSMVPKIFTIVKYEVSAF